MQRLQQLHVARFISRYGMWFDAPVNLTVLVIVSIEGEQQSSKRQLYSDIIWWVSICVCATCTIITVIVASSMRSFFWEAVMECEEKREKE